MIQSSFKDCIVFVTHGLFFQGGIKAVIWTDFLQGVIMLVASFVVIVLGLIHVGGFIPVWERSRDGGRIKVFEYVF
jgi:Na+/proline symporter